MVSSYPRSDAIVTPRCKPIGAVETSALVGDLTEDFVNIAFPLQMPSQSPSLSSKQCNVSLPDRHLSKIPNLKSINDEGQTLLHLAAQDSLHSTHWMVDHGSFIDELNIEAETPVMSAIAAGKTETVLLLLRKGADFTAVNEYGRTLLHYAAGPSQDVRITEQLLYLTSRKSIDQRDSQGQTALCTAAFHSNYAVCRALLSEGASANSHEKDGWTALHYLAMRGNSEFMERLLSKEGPDVEAFYEPDRFGLLVGVAHDSSLEEEEMEELVKLFLDNGADVDARGHGRTALEIAALTGQDVLATALLAHGATAENVNLVCLNWGLSPKTLDQLLKRGANIEACDSRWHKTPLMWASETGSLKAVNVLLRHGARLNAQDVQGISALQYACANGRIEAVRSLLRKEADISLVDNFGKSPLVAVALGKPFSLGGRFYDSSPSDRAKITNMLVFAGVNVSARDKYGGAAIHYAVKHGYLEVLKELCKDGKCDLRMEWDGKSPLQIAMRWERGLIVKWLKTQFFLNGQGVSGSQVD